MTIIIYLDNESTCIKKIRKYGGTAASLFVDRLFVTVSVKSSINKLLLQGAAKRFLQEKETMAKDVIGSAMVIGGGIAGMQTALDLADSGYYVYLVEKGPSIGGVMSQLDKTFPTNDCAM